ncbi:voltage-dependent anion channel-domain-containing protein [Fusarium oxysporum f. sp. albedinis]|nr:voltage-dependent anion channel-domain-containing protein [Fusarium oxysporum f. sp. albedinis]
MSSTPTPSDHLPDLDSSEVTYPGSDIAAPAAPTNPGELKHDKYRENRRRWRRIVVNFTPSWFTVTMGTGITCISISLHTALYHANRGQITLDQVNPSWLFPVIADIVASTSGAIVANVLPNDQHAIWTVITSYILWGTSVPMAIVILAMYYNRLMIHDILPGQVAVASFIAIGPLGMGAAAIQLLGQVSLKLFARNDFIPKAPIAGQFFYLTGILTALILWGFAVVWLFFALATIIRRQVTFNLTWWAFTFPLGVFTVATTTLAQELPSKFFKVLGTIFSVAEFLLWVMVACGTIKASLNGQLFQPPPLEAWEKKAKEVEETEKTQDSPV